MPVPTYDKLILPLLQFASDGEPHHIREAIETLAEHLQLNPEERAEMLPNGKKYKFDDRVQWANTYLKKAGLLESINRGIFQITQRGQIVLKSNPPYIDQKFLMQFPEFVKFKFPNEIDISVQQQLNQAGSEQTPEELIYSVYQGLQAKLADELLEVIMVSSATFFEQLVVDLLLAMGYGGSLGTGQRIGQSGDGGIDGYISEDKLGLDIIYVQAKRWSPDTPVGRPTVQGFVGSLMGVGATKGVLITTSSFSKQANDYAKSIPNLKIILLDGQKLTQLMIEHNVGVSVQQNYVVKKVDRDYFDID
ncbi:MAG TPA: restriction endonuclease [Phototrophicaceae bacterium]|nr:restriction endonuclease [Phototrophicaceae bacterium]